MTYRILCEVLSLLNYIVSNNITIWDNPTSSSIQYCRPVRIEFCKETAEYIKQEEAQLKEEIDNICARKYASLEINHDPYNNMTMVHGKVATGHAHGHYYL